ncbi:MAG: hypothetical protein J1G05_05710 [Clostridiales bacterium]|nr:hypothetical protein [Clostridiales bacterium]
MDNIKNMARAAKQRLKSNFWDDCKKNINENANEAKIRGVSESKVRTGMASLVKDEIKGAVKDEFYLKVKLILDSEGEVSDAIGRLTDKSVYDKLSYEEKQRYNLELSTKYLEALKRYKEEKEICLNL